MRKASSLVDTSIAVDRLTTQTDYDNIVIVKNNLPTINTIAPSVPDLVSLETIHAEIVSLYADKATLDSLYTDKTTLDAVYSELAEVEVVGADVLKGKGANTATDSAVLNALDNANVAVTKAGEANTSANSAATSALNASISNSEAAASSTVSENWATYTVDVPVPSGNGSEYSAKHWASKAAAAVQSTTYSKTEVQGAFGRLSSPLLDLPLTNNLNMKAGAGSVTFTRSTTATYIDRYGVLKSVAVDEPRFEKDGLLIEGGSTNISLYSEDETKWAVNLGSVSRDTTVANPYGVMDSIKVTMDGSVGEHYIERSDTISSSTDTYTASIFIKPVENDVIVFRMYFTGGTNKNCGTLINFSTVTASNNGKIISIGNGWYRISLTGNDNDSGNNVIRWRCYGDNASASSTTTASIYLLGGQIEKLSFASSYIPTVDAAVTRGGDSNMANYTNNMPSWSDTFTIHFEYDAINFNNGVNNIAFTTGTLANYINFTAIGTAVFSVQGRACGTSETAVQNGSKVTATSDGTTASIYIDGTFQSSIAIGTTVGTTTRLYIGSDSNNLQQVNSNIKNFKIFDVCLTPTEVSLLAGGAV